ncbi:MAG: hypothetical protein R3290_11150 [Acidimicrobiia bacterium]|nr:hypothetical protein [Acidimicrobiia bacterium]
MVDDRLLRRSLAANAVFSLGAGLAGLVAASRLASLVGVPAVWIVAVAAGLIPFGLGVLRLARMDRVDPGAARAVVAADVAWIAGAAVIVALPGVLSPEGRVVVASLTAVVAVWAVLQAMGLRRLTGS